MSGPRLPSAHWLLTVNKLSQSDHYRLLADAAADFASRGHSIARTRSLVNATPDFDLRTWRQMAGLGWTGMRVPEAAGGMGLGLREITLVAQPLAAALVPEPLAAITVLAGSALALGDNDALKYALLRQLADGTLIPALAWQETAGSIDPAELQTTARLHDASSKF